MHKLRTLHLFTGDGGGILGDLLLGHQPVCAVEIEPYCQQVLHERQQDGSLPWFPIFADVKEFDGKPWRGLVDVVCGGFPCQDISVAGSKMESKGLSGERSGLWEEMRRIVGEVGPGFVFVENSPALSFRGIGTVLSGLSEMGYNAEWGVIGAHHVGAPHKRERMWILAYANKIRFNYQQKSAGQLFQKPQCWDAFGTTFDASKLEALGAFHGKANGMAGDVDRIAAIGNGQVPAVVRLAWKTLEP